MKRRDGLCDHEEGYFGPNKKGDGACTYILPFKGSNIYVSKIVKLKKVGDNIVI